MKLKVKYHWIQRKYWWNLRKQVWSNPSGQFHIEVSSLTIAKFGGSGSRLQILPRDRFNIARNTNIICNLDFSTKSIAKIFKFLAQIFSEAVRNFIWMKSAARAKCQLILFRNVDVYLPHHIWQTSHRSECVFCDSASRGQWFWRHTNYWLNPLHL